MKFANATNLDRKSGVAQWRDLRFSYRYKRSPYRMTNRSLRPKRFRRVDACDPKRGQDRRKKSYQSE
jgi:hypothetical protein